jgi:tRNA(adenine34) deaminase
MAMVEKDSVYYMSLALEEAKKALAHDEVPIGAVVVDRDGVVIGQGCNLMETKGCQTGHAEVSAIEQACKKIGDWRLTECKIYITLEPCVMCFGLIALSRIGTIVYGAKSTLFGSGLDNKECFPLYKKNLKIESGLLEEDCLTILQDFFKLKRGKKERA